jgi:hypothetical protein
VERTRFPAPYAVGWLELILVLSSLLLNDLYALYYAGSPVKGLHQGIQSALMFLERVVGRQRAPVQLSTSRERKHQPS